MTPAYLVDSDWVIHYLHGQSEIVSKLQELQKRGLALSLISIAELYEGVYYSRDPEGNERHLKDFLRGVSVLGIDEETCKIFGRQRGRLRAPSRPSPIALSQDLRPSGRLPGSCRRRQGPQG